MLKLFNWTAANVLHSPISSWLEWAICLLSSQSMLFVRLGHGVQLSYSFNWPFWCFLSPGQSPVYRWLCSEHGNPCQTQIRSAPVLKIFDLRLLSPPPRDWSGPGAPAVGASWRTRQVVTHPQQAGYCCHIDPAHKGKVAKLVINKLSKTAPSCIKTGL